MTARLAMNENGYPVMFDRVDGIGTLRFHAPLGQREEPHTSAAGKAILAQLSEDDVRNMYDGVEMPVRTPNTITNVSDLLENLAQVLRDGYAFDDEEGAARNLLRWRCVLRPHGEMCGGAERHGPQKKIVQ